MNHLDDVAAMGVSGVLAAWGYNGEREQRQARENGHRVCSLSDIESQLFSSLSSSAPQGENPGC